MALRVIVGVLGALVVAAGAWSVLGTLIVPRRVRSKITRAVFVVVRSVFHGLAHFARTYERQDRVLSFQAPIQLMAQIVAWLALFELGFGLLLWSVAWHQGFGAALEASGSALCTLGFVAPHQSGTAAIDTLAAFAGLGTVALQIGYLPTLYAAFNRRETLITMLDSRAGVPSWGPELLIRTHYGLGSGVSGVSELPELFEAWEQWSADVSESHTTYLALAWFRSPRPMSSWVTAQLAVLDAAALYLALLPDAPQLIRARLCLRGGFTCFTNIARAMRIPVPEEADPNGEIALTFDEFRHAVEALRLVGFPTERAVEDAWADFKGWRVNYEAAAYALAWFTDAPPALWSGPRQHGDHAVAPHRPLTLPKVLKGKVAGHPVEP